MTRSVTRPLAALGALLVAFSSIGCNGSSQPAPKPPTKVVAPTETPESKDDSSGAKLFAGWKNPDGVLVISGEMNGYLEPCGCSLKQLGGMARRLDLIERTRAQGWPVATIDLGGLIADPGTALGGVEQTKVKYNVALRALALMEYEAVGVSAADLKLGVLETMGQFLNLGDHPRMVAANLEPAEGFEDAIHRQVRTAAGPVKVGVTAVIAPSDWAALNDPQKDLLTIKEPQEVLPSVLEDLEKDTDVQVLLVQGPPEMAESLGATYPGFDIVVGTSAYPDPVDKPKELNGGKTWLVNVGKKGKYVGAVGIWKDGEPRFRYQRVSLGDRYKAENAITKLINEEYQSELKALGVVENFPRRANIKAAPGSTYVGAESCQSCHPNTYAKWLHGRGPNGGGHSHAYESIVHDPRGDRQFDGECVTCHTTGFEYVGGWVSAEQTPYLKGNQCENCHGPASKHVEEPDNPAYLTPLKLVAEDAGKNLCITCHDEDNSPKFDFATYWGQIVHKGMDTYDDPKVHKGISASKIAQQPNP